MYALEPKVSCRSPCIPYRLRYVVCAALGLPDGVSEAFEQLRLPGDLPHYARLCLLGVILSWRLPWFLNNLEDAITSSAALFVLSTIGAAAIFYHADAGAQIAFTRPQFIIDLMHWIPLSLLFAIPFAFCGLILGVLLSSPDLPTRRIYCFDLLGSALGAFTVIPAITHLGVERSVVAACALLLAGAFLLTFPAGRLCRVLTAGATLVLVLSTAFSDRLFEMT